MKLFQKLIVAPAALGFLIPSAAFAEEIKLADVSNYSSSKEVKSISDFDFAEELAVTNNRIDGLESRFNDFEAGGFSETTSMKGKVEMLLGATSTDAGTEEALTFNYHYEVDFNTSFTGDDNLNVEIAAGNETGVNSISNLYNGLGEESDNLAVEDVNYSFPLGDYKITLGESLDASKNFPSSCSYSNTLNSMDDCNTGNTMALGGDISVSAGYDFDNGWSYGVGLSADDGETAAGMFTAESDDFYGAAVGYEGDNYGVTVGYSDIDTATYFGINAMYSPDAVPFTISGGVEYGDVDATGDSSSWLVGITSDVGEGTIALGVGTLGHIDDDADEVLGYEVSYDYPLNDGMSIKPFAFISEVANADDTTGLGVLTTFKF